MCAFDPRRPQDQFIRRFNVPGRPVTDMGLSADPMWMRTVLNELRPLGKPVYVTENGLATSDDEWRDRHLSETLHNVLLAISAAYVPTEYRFYRSRRSHARTSSATPRLISPSSSSMGKRWGSATCAASRLSSTSGRRGAARARRSCPSWLTPPLPTTTSRSS